MKIFSYSPLTKAVKNSMFVLAGISMLTTGQTFAAEVDEAAENEDNNKIVITGSRIKRIDEEGPAPVTVISAEDIKKQGHETVFDVLNNLAWNSGGIQGEQDANSFTPNAQAVNLRGFGQGRTLTLINGRRIADYPLPLNGQSNFVNIGVIPVAAVERIEILSSGASAIYGSDAVAGVINIILKKELDFTEISYTRGMTTEGLGDSGESDLLTIATGWSKQDWSITAGLEIRNTNPIHGFDRDYLDSTDDDPEVDPGGNLGFGTFALNLASFELVTPFNCEQIDWQVQQQHRLGPYCGYNDVGENTIRNDREKTSFFASSTYNLDNGDELFADVMVFSQTAKSNIFKMFYQPSSLPDENGTPHFVLRVFNNEETGDQSSRYDEDAFSVAVGMKGTMFDEHDFEFSLATNQYDFESKSSGFLVAGPNRTASIQDLIPTAADLFRAYQPSDFDGIIADRVRGGESAIHTLDFSLTGDLMELDAGPLAYAAVVEYAYQDYQLSANQDVIEGNFSNGSYLAGGGDRKRASVGVELAIPIMADEPTLGSLEAQVAGRYDNYIDDSDTGGAFTYTGALIWRPTDTLMFRASRATSFRAPDMHYLFAGDSTFFLNGNVDIFRCRTENNGVDYPDNCIAHTQNVAGTRNGDLTLQEEEGSSNSFGIVYEPTDDFSLSVDVYKLTLTNIIQDMSVSSLLNDEANCLIGSNPSGSLSFDQNSEFCQNAIGRVTRFDDTDLVFPGEIDSIRISPENRALRSQKGMDINARYTWETESIGSFQAAVNYTYIDSIKQKQTADEDEIEVRDIVDIDGNVNLRSRTNLTLSWQKSDFSASVFWNRLGGLPIQQGDCFEGSDDPELAGYCDRVTRLDPWKVTNVVLGYQATEDLSFRLNVNNVFNKEPIRDVTLGGWPWYQSSHHNPIGREIFLNATYRIN